MVSVDEELTRLRKENELLRAQLALYQQNQQPSVVSCLDKERAGKPVLG